ncbi:MAG: hypothetical protein D6805_07025, partial [Planctomycetota bacterium]
LPLLQKARQRELDQLRRKRLLQKLIREQEELRRRTKELAQKMQKTPPQENLEQASKQMDEAQRNIERQHLDESLQEQKQAQKYLEKSKENLEKKLNKYKEKKQQEELFNIHAKLQQMIQRQKQINQQTLKIENTRLQFRGRLPRYLRRKILKELIPKEKKQIQDARNIQKKLEQEGSTVYASQMKSIQQDLDNIIQQMRRPPSGESPTGEYTQLAQNQVLKKLVRLKDAFKVLYENRKQKKKNKKQKTKKRPQNQKPMLIPPIAELKLMLELQKELREKTEDLQRAIRLSGGKPTEIQNRLLQRLVEEQNNLAETWQKMIDSLKKRFGQ